MEAIQDKFQEIVDGFIDFEGQKLAETLTTYILSVSALVGFAIGFALQDIRYTLYISLAGMALTFLAVVPAWPFYNRNPVNFLKSSVVDAAGKGATGPTTIIVGGEKVSVKT